MSHTFTSCVTLGRLLELFRREGPETWQFWSRGSRGEVNCSEAAQLEVAALSLEPKESRGEDLLYSFETQHQFFYVLGSCRANSMPDEARKRLAGLPTVFI